MSTTGPVNCITKEHKLHVRSYVRPVALEVHTSLVLGQCAALAAGEAKMVAIISWRLGGGGANLHTSEIVLE